MIRAGCLADLEQDDAIEANRLLRLLRRRACRGVTFGVCVFKFDYGGLQVPASSIYLSIQHPPRSQGLDLILCCGGLRFVFQPLCSLS